MFNIFGNISLFEVTEEAYKACFNPSPLLFFKSGIGQKGITIQINITENLLTDTTVLFF